MSLNFNLFPHMNIFLRVYKAIGPGYKLLKFKFWSQGAWTYIMAFMLLAAA